MKWILLRSEKDLPSIDWRGAARVFLSDLNYKYFAADFIELKAHITGDLIMSGIEWLDESLSTETGQQGMELSNRGKYVIIDLRNMDFMKNEKNEINYYDTREEAAIVCGMYEFENVWVCKLIYNHIEPK